MQLASQVARRVRLWARHDDSLSLDSPALPRSNIHAETYFAGVQYQFAEQ